METPVNQRAHGLKRLAANSAGRDFVVGDLHGQYDLLMGELDRAGFDRDTDRLICVGDLVDRGPQSVECLSLLREPWFFAVLGNHADTRQSLTFFSSLSRRVVGHSLNTLVL